jgi:probable LLM family oxidoreductase
MQFGAYTFVETQRDPRTGEPVDVDKSFANVLEQIELADRVGLDVFGLGEHHRADYAVSAPAVALAAAAARTKRIRLTSAVSVLSSDDPVRVYQQFATLDLLSGGRAEIMAGRGSFIESFPLFGYDLQDYDELFAEKLDLLLAVRANAHVVWKGRHRAPLSGQGVYPRALQEPLPVWIASGGTPQSVARAGVLALPLAIAIIGGEPARFGPLADLYREAGRRAVVAEDKLAVGINGHGFLADTAEAAIDAFFPPYAEVMSRIGRERGWPPLTRAQFDQGRGPRGHLMVGTTDEAIAKISLSTACSDTSAISCKCRSARSRRRRSSARSSFWGLSSRQPCGRRWRTGRFRPSGWAGRPPR